MACENGEYKYNKTRRIDMSISNPAISRTGDLFVSPPNFSADGKFCRARSSRLVTLMISSCFTDVLFPNALQASTLSSRFCARICWQMLSVHSCSGRDAGQVFASSEISLSLTFNGGRQVKYGTMQGILQSNEAIKSCSTIVYHILRRSSP
ncbi:hypothetical protein AA313_de0206785 [Arthrobotrys entomopaga]|nr:hypothetical protein AA313_de0206785 [Arthrobotrys entomopaga]